LRGNTSIVQLPLVLAVTHRARAGALHAPLLPAVTEREQNDQRVYRSRMPSETSIDVTSASSTTRRIDIGVSDRGAQGAMRKCFSWSARIHQGDRSTA
jgi:hypothetical protein